MIEYKLSLASSGAVKAPGYEDMLRFGYNKNCGVYRLRVTAADEWKGMKLRVFWHTPEGDPPASLAMALVHEPWQPCATVPVLACHHPQAVAGHTVIAGHLHPTLRLRGPARDALRTPCFGWGDGQLVLPAFGAFTGTAPDTLPAHWAQFAVLPGRVVAVPGTFS